MYLPQNTSVDKARRDMVSGMTFCDWDSVLLSFIQCLDMAGWQEGHLAGQTLPLFPNVLFSSSWGITSRKNELTKLTWKTIIKWGWLSYMQCFYIYLRSTNFLNIVLLLCSYYSFMYSSHIVTYCYNESQLDELVYMHPLLRSWCLHTVRYKRAELLRVNDTISDTGKSYSW